MSDGRQRQKYAYSPKHRLGAGSFAQVFLGGAQGPDGRMTRKVAIKRIDKQRMSTNPKMTTQLQNEIRLLRELRGNDHVVYFYDSFESPDHMHLVLEYCDGGDLLALIRRSPATMSEPTIHDLLSQLAEALKHLRKHDVVHRDIKPQNILLHRDSTRPSRYLLKLTDFGFACRLSSQDLTATFCGSPLHMAPEILSGNRYDPKIDLWSFGTIAYQLATGCTPYRARSVKELRTKLLQAERRGERPPLPTHLSTEFVDLTHCLLQLDPVERIDFDAFFAHPFFAQTYTDVKEGEVIEVVATVLSDSPPSSIVDPPDGYVVVDRRAIEFAEHLEKLCVETDTVLKDDARQASLRQLALGAVDKASVIMQVAESTSLFESLALHSRALRILRESADRARDYLKMFETTRPCPETVAVAHRFRDAMERCLQIVNVLRKRARSEDGDHPDQRAVEDALCDAATALTERAHTHTKKKEKTAAGALYRRAILILGVARDGLASTDAERVDRLIHTTEQRLGAVNSTHLSQIGLSTIADGSCTLGETTHIPRSVPIDIPINKNTRRRRSSAAAGSAELARFCRACGVRYLTQEDRFCAMCGTQRSMIVSSTGVTQSLPQSWK